MNNDHLKAETTKSGLPVGNNHLSASCYPELKKQYWVSLYNTEILITTDHNNKEAFVGKIKTKHEITIGWHNWIETEVNAMNYMNAVVY